MRKLLIIGICLLIVTLAVGADARDRNSRDSNSSSVSSRDSSSSSDRQSGVSNDRQKSSSSDTTNRRSSTPSSDSSRTTNSGYRPGGTANTVTRSNAGSSSSFSGGSSRSAYSGYRQNATPDTITRSKIKPPSSDNNRQIYSGYRPDTQQKSDIQTNTRTIPTTSTRGNRDIYSAYRPSTTDRSINPISPANRGTLSGRTVNNSYNPGNSADTTNSINRSRTDSLGKTRDKTGNDATSYRPARGTDSSNRSNTTLGDRTRSQDHSGYRPGTGTSGDRFQTTQSGRDRKLGDSRTMGFGSYRPSTDRSFTFANYSRPKGYRPPNYRSGQYYYQTPRYTRPCYFGFWDFDYYSGFSRRSLYFHYGLFPYIAITRIILDSYPTVVYVDQPIYSTSGISYEGNGYSGLDDALADIRGAWVSGRYDLIERHVQDSYDIAVLLDGKYDYSVTAGDYLAMTQDALGGMDTASFVWNKVQPRRDGTITAFATHTYWSGSSTRKVYVNYTLQRVGRDYYIVEAGSTQVAWN